MSSTASVQSYFVTFSTLRAQFLQFHSAANFSISRTNVVRQTVLESLVAPSFDYPIRLKDTVPNRTIGEEIWIAEKR